MSEGASVLMSSWPLLIGLGGLSGFLSGLLGIGGGAVIVPALVLALPMLGIEGEALRGVDLVVVFGAPVFTFHVEGHRDLLANGTPIWQITDDPTEAASAPVGESLIGTMPISLAALLAALPKTTSRQAPAPRRTPPAPVASTPIPPSFALSRLSALLPEGAIIVEEAPSHRPAIQDYLPCPGADSFYTMASGGLGYSLPASVGIALARPGRRIVCLIGDGSAMYSIQAIWTAAQRKLPITFVVMNNSGYGAMRFFSRIMQAEGVLDIAAARVKAASDRIEDLISPAELEEVAASYRQVAGFVRKASEASEAP
jgi:thiamine pyrophosphate-dependent acetolactate synthase large subunit-like protein